jgi:hypothetical protein
MDGFDFPPSFSHLNEFSRTVVQPFDVDLLIAVVSSECLRVDDEVRLFCYLFRFSAHPFLLIDNCQKKLLFSHPTPQPVRALPRRQLHVLDVVGRWLAVDPARCDYHGARVLQHIRFSRVPLESVEQWLAPHQLDCPPLYALCCQSLLDQLAAPVLDVRLLSTSGWGNTRFYPIPLYHRQSATVFQQEPDTGLIRAIALSPDRSLLFTGSAATSSSEIVVPLVPNGPMPSLRVWNTQTWACQQTISCNEDIVAVVVQEYPDEVYRQLQAHARSILTRRHGRKNRKSPCDGGFFGNLCPALEISCSVCLLCLRLSFYLVCICLPTVR